MHEEEEQKEVLRIKRLFSSSLPNPLTDSVKSLLHPGPGGFWIGDLPALNQWNTDSQCPGYCLIKRSVGRKQVFLATAEKRGKSRRSISSIFKIHGNLSHWNL